MFNNITELPQNTWWDGEGGFRNVGTTGWFCISVLL